MNQAFWNAIDCLVEKSTIVIDRPKGSSHPNYPQLIYPVDYGYLSDTSSMDGGGIDLWLGSLENTHTDAVICTVDLIKRDSEVKLLIGCSDEEKALALTFHNCTPCMNGMLIDRR